MKRFIVASSGAISTLFFATRSFGQGAVGNANPCLGNTDVLCTLGIGGGGLGSLVGKGIQFIFVIAALVALGYLVWGGIKWITSGGEKAGVEGARNHIIAAIIGLVVIFLSYLIINVVLYFFTGGSLSNLSFPSLVPPK